MTYRDATITTIQTNLASVRARVAATAVRAGRAPNDVLLVAVSKTHPIEAIAEAYSAGQRDFGENRLEELWPKVHAAEAMGLVGIRWHLIGPIQSRKTADAVGPWALLQAVDRVKIADRLSRSAVETGLVLDVLLELNVSGEASKHGFTPDALLASVGHLSQLPGIRTHGLMTMAPYVTDPEETRPVFRRLRQVRDELKALQPHVDWSQLSMGMTNDFEVAIEEGATIVRIGSAIFGSRT